MAIRLQPSVIRGARGMLDWSLTTLADVAGLSISTVKRMEAGEHQRASNESYKLVRAAFEAAGVTILEDRGDGPGVRLRRR